MVNIFDVPEKTTINKSLQAKSIMLCGKSKTGKSTIAAQAPKPIFLMTENGTEALTGFTPIPIASWGDFKSAVAQLCTPKARETWMTVCIDTYTNLILLLDKFIGSKMSNEKESYDYGSDLEYGRGQKSMKNELGTQLQKLANQGYLLLNIVHAEDKADFKTQKPYIGTSLSNSLYGVAEKFVDQIVYLRKDINAQGEEEHTIWFNPKGGFNGAGGRFTPEMDYVPCSFENLEKALIDAMEKLGEKEGVTLIESSTPAVTIEPTKYDFDALVEEFQNIVGDLMGANPANANKITAIVEEHLGRGCKVSDATPAQAEQIFLILNDLKSL